MEFFDIVDENGKPTGKTIERTLAHQTGAPHRTAHVWLLDISGREPLILLQKRSDDKDCFPGRYDISSAGHIPAGCGYTQSAIRELKEELGVIADEKELIFIGSRHDSFTETFYGKPFIDDQFCNVYILICSKDTVFTLQKEEVSEVKWMPLAECIKAVNENTLPHCIAPEELEMISSWYEKSKSNTKHKK